MRNAHVLPAALATLALTATASAQMGETTLEAIAGQLPQLQQDATTQGAGAGDLAMATTTAEGHLRGVLLDANGMAAYDLDLITTRHIAMGSSRFEYGGVYGVVRARQGSDDLFQVALVSGEWVRFGSNSPNGQFLALIHAAEQGPVLGYIEGTLRIGSNGMTVVTSAQGSSQTSDAQGAGVQQAPVKSGDDQSTSQLQPQSTSSQAIGDQQAQAPEPHSVIVDPGPGGAGSSAPETSSQQVGNQQGVNPESKNDASGDAASQAQSEQPEPQETGRFTASYGLLD